MPQANPPINTRRRRLLPWILAGVALILAGAWLQSSQRGKTIGEALSGPPAGTSAAVVSETGATEVLTLPTGTKELRSGEGIPTDILVEMQRCLKASELSETGLPTESLATPSPADPVRILRTEEALAEIEKDLGPAMMQGDLWTDWIIRLPEGMDRKIHLENIEDSTGRIQQNLSIFQIDQSGKASRVAVNDVEERNPDMGTISSLLNEGEILRKETSRYFQFASGERLELIELDGRPTEFEIVRGEIFFRCDKMEHPDNCTCIR